MKAKFGQPLEFCHSGFRLRIQMNLVKFIVVFLAFATPNAITAQTVYGDCPQTAQAYQDRYTQLGRVEDLVCMQRALQRELSGLSVSQEFNGESENLGEIGRLVESMPNHDLIDLYCIGQESRDHDACRILQTQAETYLAERTSIDNPNYAMNRDLVSSCRFWTAAGEPRGSMGIVDSTVLARCLSMGREAASSLYISCVRRATGEEVSADILPNISQRQSGRIQECIDLMMPLSF